MAPFWMLRNLYLFLSTLTNELSDLLSRAIGCGSLDARKLIDFDLRRIGLKSFLREE